MDNNMSSDMDELDNGHIEMIGFDFDYETPLKSPWDRVRDHLKGRATKHCQMSPEMWNEYIHAQSEYCSGTVCKIIKRDGGGIKLYAIVGISQVVPMTSLFTAANINHEAMSSLTDELVVLGEILSNRADDTDTSR